MPVRVFPVGLEGSPQFRDEWLEAKGRKHEGTDVFAKEGTRVLAVDDGHVSFGQNDLGGNVARLVVEDGTTYYYAHLQRTEGPMRDVRAGDVIGYVGKTGNARGTSPHLHFGIYPPGKGVPPIDPFAALASAAERSSSSVYTAPSSGIVDTSRGGSWVWLVVLYMMSKKRRLG